MATTIAEDGTDIRLCAVEDCDGLGRPQVCLYDGRYHHHGFIHYGEQYPEMAELGLTFRTGEWRGICEPHYATLKVGRQKYATTDRAKAAAS